MPVTEDQIRQRLEALEARVREVHAEAAAIVADVRTIPGTAALCCAASEVASSLTCQVTFTPALSRPAAWEIVILEGDSQAAILNRLQEILSRSDRTFKTITLNF